MKTVPAFDAGPTRRGFGYAPRAFAPEARMFGPNL